MATAEVSVSDVQFSAGQNEGIERSILPLPQLAAVQNARLRKAGRWGKRYGTETIAPTTDSSGNTLGSGTGNIRTIGNGFVVVDDTCRLYDSVSSTWRDAKTLAPVNHAADLFLANPRIPGVVSGWLPSSSFFPVPPAAYQLQTQGPCAQASFLGYLWSAITFIDPLNAGDVMIRLVATSPNQTVVFLKDFRAATAGNGGVTYPRLIVCGATLVLSYAEQLSGGAPTVTILALATLAGGFAVTSSGPTTLDSSGAYDIYSYSATQFIFVQANTGAGTASVALYTAATLAIGTLRSYAPTLPTINGISVVGSSTTPIYITIGEHNAAGPIDNTTVVVWDSTLASVAPIGSVVLSTSVSQTSYCALLPGATGVRCIFGFNSSGSPFQFVFEFADVTPAATRVTAKRLLQFRYQPISRPAVISGQVYVWCTNADVADGAFGYPTLLRVPAFSELNGAFPTALPAGELSCPLEAALQDFLVATDDPPSLDPKGFSGFVEIATSATYSWLYPALTNVPDLSTGLVPTRDFRAIAFRHFTDVPMQRSVTPIIADDSQFLPGAALTRVDERGAIESGFAQVPLLTAFSATTGDGLLTPNVTYQYAAIYKSRNANGRIEVSGVSPIASFAIGTNNTGVIELPPLTVGARQNVFVEIYRTAGDGDIFYLTDLVIDGGIKPSSTGLVGPFNDLLSDVHLIERPVLYTQVGQTLPNSLPPPCRFGVLGGQRIWLGGLLRGDVIHASKSILGDQSPSWADSDSFRVVLPADCTGLAWMDNLVVFTAEGIYVVSGDGPDDSGQNGEFAAPVRLPFAMGCIEPRSVVTVEQGTFFQTARGLYMLPRGFGDPIPAGDFVMTTLALFPIITGTAVLTKAQERTVRWSCCDTINSHGVHLIFDLVHNVWSVDRVGNQSFAPGNNSFPAVSISRWVDGEIASAGNQLVVATFSETSSTYDDNGTDIVMQLQTGDIRPFGLTSHGVVSRLMVLAELRSATTLFITKSSDAGSSTASRVFTGVAPDYVIGNVSYTECELGKVELRDLTKLSLLLKESSTLEGLAFIGLALETAESQGMAKLKLADRVT